MLAYRVSNENMPLIIELNEGVAPLIEEYETFIVFDTLAVEPTTLVTQLDFWRLFSIIRPINETAGRYLVDRR